MTSHNAFKNIIMMMMAAFIIGTLLILATGCTRQPMFLLDSSGIATYDRRDGKFEILWEHQQKPAPVIHDTIYIYLGEDGKFVYSPKLP